MLATLQQPARSYKVIWSQLPNTSNKILWVLVVRQWAKQQNMHKGCTCNIDSTAVYWKANCSWSSALHYCPIQSDHSSDCQGGGHVSQITTCSSHAVGSICEGGHKGDVTALGRCDIIAVHTSPNWCAIQHESYTTEKWLNKPVQSKPLHNSASISHHLSRAGLPHTHTGVQDNSSCTSRTTYITWLHMHIRTCSPP